MLNVPRRGEWPAPAAESLPRPSAGRPGHLIGQPACLGVFVDQSLPVGGLRGAGAAQPEGEARQRAGDQRLGHLALAPAADEAALADRVARLVGPGWHRWPSLVPRAWPR